jgi:hypothetical protein
MLIAGGVVILFIVGLFLEMLSSSPKPEPEWHPDTDGENRHTPPVPDVEATALHS